MACIALNQLYSTVQRGHWAIARGCRPPSFGRYKSVLIIKPVENFLITDCLQSSQIPILHKRTHFFDEPLVYHLDDATVNPVIKHITRPCKADFLYFKVTFSIRRCLEWRERTSSHEADLKGTYHSLSVCNIYCIVTFRIEPLQIPSQRIHSFFLQTGGQLGTELQVSLRKIIKTIYQSVHIEPGSSCHDKGIVTFSKQTIYQFQSLQFVFSGRI